MQATFVYFVAAATAPVKSNLNSQPLPHYMDERPAKKSTDSSNQVAGANHPPTTQPPQPPQPARLALNHRSGGRGQKLFEVFFARIFPCVGCGGWGVLDAVAKLFLFIRAFNKKQQKQL